jgi:opacity protein-like surface antigen
VNLKGSSVSTSNSTTVDTPPGGLAGTTATASTSASTGLTDLIENRWLVSALLRGGRLVDPDDYVYLLGGYTYGRFQAEGEGFGLSGGTIGAGWEKRLVPGWTVKAEYRYTRFQNKDLFLNSQGSTSGTPSTSNSSSSADIHFSDIDMHSVWVGVSHYFGTY